MTLAELFTIHMNLHAMEFPLLFGETNFVEVPKIHEIYRPQKKVPYSSQIDCILDFLETFNTIAT